MKKRETYERTSNDYLTLNSCGIQKFFEYGAAARREMGRVDYHVLYVAAGTCHVTLDGEVTAAKEGSFILFRPGERQEYAYLAGERSVSYYIHFTGVGCEELLRRLGLYDIRIAEMGKDPAFEQLFEKMARERDIGLCYSEALSAAILAELLATAARAIETRRKGFAVGTETRIVKACQMIYDGLATVSVAGLARACFLSEGRFSHLFRESVGKSPMQYIMELRIKRAKELLTDTEMTVCEVGSAVGFNDQNYFSRIFRKYTGHSPLSFKNKFYS